MVMSGFLYAFLAVLLSYTVVLVDAAAPDHRTEVRVTATAAAGYPFGKPVPCSLHVSEQRKLTCGLVL